MPDRNYATKQRTSVTLNVESHPSWDPQGVLGNLGRWDMRSGGEAGGDEQKIRPAGGKEIAIGGIQTTENVTISRKFHLTRDSAIIGALYKARNKAEASAAQELLDRHEDPIGEMTQWSGVLLSVSEVEADSTSSDEAEIVCVISTDSDVARL
jgi:hypothetical protein